MYCIVQGGKRGDSERECGDQEKRMMGKWMETRRGTEQGMEEDGQEGSWEVAVDVKGRR